MFPENALARESRRGKRRLLGLRVAFGTPSPAKPARDDPARQHIPPHVRCLLTFQASHLQAPCFIDARPRSQSYLRAAYT